MAQVRCDPLMHQHSVQANEVQCINAVLIYPFLSCLVCIFETSGRGTERGNQLCTDPGYLKGPDLGDREEESRRLHHNL